jgi:hypothetical protein
MGEARIVFWLGNLCGKRPRREVMHRSEDIKMNVRGVGYYGTNLITDSGHAPLTDFCGQGVLFVR